MFNKFTVAILSVFSLFLIVFKPLDRTPLEGSRYYYNSLENVDKIRDDIVNTLSVTAKPQPNVPITQLLLILFEKLLFKEDPALTPRKTNDYWNFRR